MRCCRQEKFLKNRKKGFFEVDIKTLVLVLLGVRGVWGDSSLGLP